MSYNSDRKGYETKDGGLIRIKGGDKVGKIDQHNVDKSDVNGNIRMYKKCNIKMHKIVHSFCYTFNRIRRYNMKEINKIFNK